MKTTALGYPVLSDDLHLKIFGSDYRPEMNGKQKDQAISLLRKFGIETPVDYPESIYDGPVPLPNLKADNIRDHFEKIAENQVGRYKQLGDKFAKCTLPKIPSITDLVFQSGWTRYELIGDGPDKQWQTREVPYPEEKVFTFDTETFVKGGAFPIIGTALSDRAAYIWLAAELINPDISENDWDQYKLIPIGTDRLVIGHNISYDRVRAQEGYSLDFTKPENFYFDTLSAHVGVSGLASGQRWLYALAEKDFDLLDDDEKRKLKYSPEWLDRGSTNSLVKTYNFHVQRAKEFFFDDGDVKPLSDSDKEIRNVFVTADTLSEINKVLAETVDYAIKDAYYTSELFQALWPKYLDSTPSMVGLCGHYHLNGSGVPLVDNWFEWVQGAEEVYNSHNQEMTGLCKTLLWDTFNSWKEIVDNNETKEIGVREASKWVSKDPWIRQLDWEVKSTKGVYAWIPTWMRPYKKDPDKEIGVKSKLSHFLLKLKWEGTPIIWEEGQGWCFTTGDGTIDRIPHPKKPGENVGGLFSKEFVTHMEVGRLSSDLPEAKRALEIANAISFWTSVRSRVKSRIVMGATNPLGKPNLVTLPEIVCHGTVTRRVVESLMATMCSTKSWRIGTELKTRVQAPEGWKIISADYDGQEMQIASIYSDKWEGGFIGCSPMGYNVLSGSKENGTDPHTALARAIFPELYEGLIWDKTLGICYKYDEKPEDSDNCHPRDGYWVSPIDREKDTMLKITRDLAKIVGFATLYGGSVKALSNPIRMTFPDKDEDAVKTFALKAIASKKGVSRFGKYEGGSDSGAFNMMERISMGPGTPRLPCLGTKISTAMMPSAVGNDFKTGRTNWAIQASGSEILSITLTAVAWLAEEFKIPYRFIISIHDELHFMTPEKYAEQFAVLFQIAHLFTWCLFHHAMDIPELPLSRAFFSSVAIDDRLRKSPKENTVTPSNQSGGDEPHGVEYSMTQLFEMGAVNKLTFRYDSIQKGLI